LSWRRLTGIKRTPFCANLAEPLGTATVLSKRFPESGCGKKVLIAQMQERVAQCRRLAISVMNEKAAAALRQMAHEIEATIAGLRRANWRLGIGISHPSLRRLYVITLMQNAAPSPDGCASFLGGRLRPQTGM